MSIASPTSEEILASANDPGGEGIQFFAPPSREALETLEREILRRRHDFVVRFYGFHKSRCDLDFLQFIPSVSNLVLNCLTGPVDHVGNIGRLRHLTTLKIGILELTDLSFLDELPPTLEAFHLEQVHTRKLSLKRLSRFTAIKELYVERHHQDIEVIGDLGSLEDLTLRSITVPSLSFLTPLFRLRNLKLKLGGTTNLNALPDLRNVRRLEIWQVRRLQTISPVAEMRSLRSLYLQDLPNIVRFPSLAASARLVDVAIHHLKHLEDLDGIAEAPNLESLALGGPSACPAESFKPLVSHPTLKKLLIGQPEKKVNAIKRVFDGSRIQVQSFRELASQG